MIHKIFILAPVRDMTDEGIKAISIVERISNLSGLSEFSDGSNLNMPPTFDVSVGTVRLPGVPENKTVSLDNEFVQLKGIDILLNILPPHYFSKTNHRNIAIFEPSCARTVQNANMFSLLDKCLVYSEKQKQIVSENTPSKRVEVIKPYCIYPAENKGLAKNISENFIFYIPPNITNQRDLNIVLRSFLSSFDINDKVALAVYSQNSQEILSIVNNAKNSLSRYAQDYYPEIMILDNLEELHIRGHCIVDASGSFVVNVQTMHAIKHNNGAIVIDNNALLDWVPKERTSICKSHDVIHFIAGEKASTPVMCECDLSRIMIETFRNRTDFFIANRKSSSNKILNYDENDIERLRSGLCS
jgi:hypothetical protein